MPSTVVHVALAGLIGTALLADYFDAKAILVVMGATAFLDLDVIVGFWIQGAHRAAFHTLLLPGVVGVLLWWDLRGRTHPRIQSWIGAGTDSHAGSWVRERSRVHSRWGARGARVGWVSVAAMTFAGIGPDAFFNGANLFYPIHDQFYELSGEVLYSTTDGFVQTLVNVNLDALIDSVVPDGGSASAGEGAGASGGGSGGSGDTESVSTTENTHYRTGIDAAPGEDPEEVERIFPIAMTGERALLALTGYAVVGVRIWEEWRSD